MCNPLDKRAHQQIRIDIAGNGAFDGGSKCGDEVRLLGGGSAGKERQAGKLLRVHVQYHTRKRCGVQRNRTTRCASPMRCARCHGQPVAAAWLVAGSALTGRAATVRMRWQGRKRGIERRPGESLQPTGGPSEHRQATPSGASRIA